MAQRSMRTAFNQHDIYWQVINAIVAFNNRIDQRVANHLILDFIFDLERKFDYYCENMDHSQFSLLKAWKALSLVHDRGSKNLSDSKRLTL